MSHLREIRNLIRDEGYLSEHKILCSGFSKKFVDSIECDDIHQLEYKLYGSSKPMRLFFYNPTIPPMRT